MIIVERSIRLFFVVIFLLIANFAEIFEVGDEKVISEFGGHLLGGAAALLAIIVFFSWLSWKFTYISTVDDNLIYESGVIFKRKVSIPVSKINTIDKGRNLFQRIVGTQTLKIDTGAIAGAADKKAELDLVFSVKRGDEIRDYILNRSAQDESALRSVGDSPIIEHGEPQWAIKASFWDFFLYGLTSSSVLKLFGMLFVVACFVAQLSESVLEVLSDAAQPAADAVVGLLTKSPIFMLIALAIAIVFVLFVICNIVNIAWAAIRFYNFRVARDGDNVVIRYGLISLKNYTLPVRNIHAIQIKQNIWQQLLKKASVEIITVGYGNEQNETALLFPLIGCENLDALINEVLPEYSGSVEMRYSGKKGAHYNITIPLIVWGIVLSLSAVVLSSVFENSALAIVLCAAMFGILALGYVLSHKHTAIGCSDRAVDVQSGGFIKTRTHIRTDAVQSVTTTAGIFKRRKHIANFVVAYHAPAINSHVMAKSFDEEYLNEIVAIIED